MPRRHPGAAIGAAYLCVTSAAAAAVAAPPSPPWACVEGWWCGAGVSTNSTSGGDAEACEAACASRSGCAASTYYPTPCGTGCPSGKCCFLALDETRPCDAPLRSECADAKLCRRHGPSPPNPNQTFDLTAFETVVLPAWLAQFRSASGPRWNYSFTPTSSGAGDTASGALHRRRSPLSSCSGPSLYAPVDVASVWWIVGQLETNFTPSELAAWGAHLDSFQRPADGSYGFLDCEASGFEPWHADATGVVGTRFFRPSPGPPHPLRWLDFVCGPSANASGWEAFFGGLLNSTSHTIWSGSHAIAGLPLSAVMFNSTTVCEPFFDWFFKVLEERQDAVTGYWGAPVWRPIQQLGGAFHILLVYKKLGRPWPQPELIVNTTLSTQSPDTGLWLGADQAGFMGMDGVFSALQSSLQADKYRWADVRLMCVRFLSSQVPRLNTLSDALKKGSTWSVNTHSMMAPLAAVAECQRAFPGMVRTSRPWRDLFDGFAPW